MIKIINDVLTIEDCQNLYGELISQNIWNLTRVSEDAISGSFPGCTLIDNGETSFNHPYLIGYFTCLFDRINQKLKEQHNFSLNRYIHRIALNAQNNNHYTEFHQDIFTENSYSIVGFFTPQWAGDWGGELNIEGTVFKYRPGDFILFNSHKLHKSEKIKQIPFWRTSVSYVIKKSSKGIY